jgi:hypothetical protein
MTTVLESGIQTGGGFQWAEIQIQVNMAKIQSGG